MHVNANKVNDADYGLINYEKTISVHTLAEGIRCWWPSLISFSLMAGTFNLIKDWPPLWCPAPRFIDEDDKEVLLTISKMWFKTLEDTDGGIRVGRGNKLQISHISGPANYGIGSTDYGSKTLMWKNILNSVPVSLADCMEDAESPAQLMANIVRISRDAGYMGDPVLPGSGKQDFTHYQYKGLYQCQHTISDLLRDKGVID